VEDYTSRYKGEQVEVALFGGDYQDGVLTAYCVVDDVAHDPLRDLGCRGGAFVAVLRSRHQTDDRTGHRTGHDARG